MANKLINLVIKLGVGTLLEEAVREHISDHDFTHRGVCRDANEAYKAGTYTVNMDSTNVPHQYGILNVYRRQNDNNYIWQEMRNSGDLMWTRTKWNGAWTAWKSRG